MKETHVIYVICEKESIELCERESEERQSNFALTIMVVFMTLISSLRRSEGQDQWKQEQRHELEWAEQQ